MARSTEYWYDIMIQEKQSLASLNTLQPNIDSAQTLLTDVTTTSKVSRWRFWLWVVASCANAVDVVMDLFKIDLEGISKKSRYGTIPWYVQKAYEFQYGDALVFQDLEWKYSPINLNNRIIKRAAGQEDGNTVNLKFAALSGGLPVQLSAPQKAAVTAYFENEKLKPAGVKLNIISDPPDELRFFAFINYDPMILTANGDSILNPGSFPVQAAINKYLNDLNDAFNGVFELSTAIDKIQLVTGVTSAYINSAQARYGANPFQAFSQRYLANAGYMKIDPTTPLSSTLLFTANV